VKIKAQAPTTEGKTRSNEPFVEFAHSADGWEWGLWSGNGVLLARSAEGYKNRKHAIEAWDKVKAMVPLVRVEAASSEDS
jgi:uncharacterized protein YegP (UPF0339 family)